MSQQQLDTVDDVLSQLVIKAHISTKEDKRVAKAALETAFELGKVAAIMDFQEFLNGQYDCQQGKPAKDTLNESYNKGYAAQWQLEQNNKELGIR